VDAGQGRGDRAQAALQRGAGAHDCLAEVDDSFKEFMFGAYSVLKKRFWRPFGTGCNESVHESVWQRWKAKPEYRPDSLRQHPDRPA